MTNTTSLPFTERDMLDAFHNWGANCGPAALAFATRRHIEAVRDAIPGFAAKRYTSPTMMAEALHRMAVSYKQSPPLESFMFVPGGIQLVRVQFTGPWTQPGANPRWAYRHTHWVAAWRSRLPEVFDINGGAMAFSDWKAEIAPAVAASIPRADGGWHPTHVWRITEALP